MENIRQIMTKYLLLVIVFAFFLILLTIVMTCYLRKNKDKKVQDVYLFGVFMNYSDKQIISLTFIMINFLLLCFFLAMKYPINLTVIIVSMTLIILASLLSMKFLKALLCILINIINLGIIYFGHLVNNLRIEATDSKYLYLQIAIMVFGLLFYFFTMFLYIKNIAKKELNNEKS